MGPYNNPNIQSETPLVGNAFVSPNLSTSFQLKIAPPVVYDTDLDLFDSQLQDFCEHYEWVLADALLTEIDNQPFTTASCKNFKLLTIQGDVFANSLLEALRKLSVFYAQLDNKIDDTAQYRTPTELLKRICSSIGASYIGEKWENKFSVHIPTLYFANDDSNFIHPEIASKSIKYLEENYPEILKNPENFVSDCFVGKTVTIKSILESADALKDVSTDLETFTILPDSELPSKTEEFLVFKIPSLSSKTLYEGELVFSPDSILEEKTYKYNDKKYSNKELLETINFFDEEVKKVMSFFEQIAFDYCYNYSIPTIDSKSKDDQDSFWHKHPLGKNHNSYIFKDFNEFICYVEKFQKWVKEKRSFFIKKHNIDYLLLDTIPELSLEDNYRDFVNHVIKSKALESFNNSIYTDSYLDNLKYLSVKDAKNILLRFKSKYPNFDLNDSSQTDKITIFSSDKLRRIHLKQAIALSELNDDKVLFRFPNREPIKIADTFFHRIVAVNLTGLDKRLLSANHYIEIVDKSFGDLSPDYQGSIHNQIVPHPNHQLFLAICRIQDSLKDFLSKENHISTDCLSDLIIVDENGNCLFYGLSEFLQFSATFHQLNAKEYQKICEQRFPCKQTKYYNYDSTPIIELGTIGELQGHNFGFTPDKLPTCPITGRTAGFHTSLLDGYLAIDQIPIITLRLVESQLINYINNSFIGPDEEVVCCDTYGSIFLSLRDIQNLFDNKQRVKNSLSIGDFTSRLRLVKHSDDIVRISELNNLFNIHVPTFDELESVIKQADSIDNPAEKKRFKERIYNSFHSHFQYLEEKFLKIASEYFRLSGVNILDSYSCDNLHIALRATNEYQVSFDNITQLAHCWFKIYNYLHYVASSTLPRQEVTYKYSRKYESVIEVLDHFANYFLSNTSQSIDNYNKQYGFISVRSNKKPDEMTSSDALNCIAQIDQQLITNTKETIFQLSSEIIQDKKIIVLVGKKIYECTLDFLIYKLNVNLNLHHYSYYIEKAKPKSPSVQFNLEDRPIRENEPHIVCNSLHYLRLGIETNINLLQQYIENIPRLKKSFPMIALHMEIDPGWWFELIQEDLDLVKEYFADALNQYLLQTDYEPGHQIQKYLRSKVKLCDEDNRVIFEDFSQFFDSYERFMNQFESIKKDLSIFLDVPIPNERSKIDTTILDLALDRIKESKNPGQSNKAKISSNQVKKQLLQISKQYGLSSEITYLTLLSLGFYGKNSNTVDKFLTDNDEFSSNTKSSDQINTNNTLFLLSDFIFQSKDELINTTSVLTLSDFIKILSLKENNNQIDKALVHLKSLESNELHPLILESIQLCIKQLNSLTDFKEPNTIKTILCPLQIEAVLGAHHKTKPIVIGGTGVGKTEIGVCFAEYEKAERIIYITKTSNRSGVQKRIKESILRDPKGIELLTKEHWKITPKQFRDFLQKSKYLIAGADTIADLEKKSPENFLVLKEWLNEKRSAKVLDEVHILDNDKTYRFKSCQKLTTDVQISMTGTPTQHALSKLPNIFTITLPENLQPSTSELRKMKKDSSLAIHFLRSVSTIFSLEDMASYFVSSNTIPYEEQLKTGPKIPKTDFSSISVPLTVEQSLTYLDLEFNFKKWANEHSRPIDPLAKVWAYKKLISNPSALGLPAKNPILDAAIKEITESVSLGKRVLIFSDHTYPLHELKRRLDHLGIGSHLLDGSVSPEQREDNFKDLETNPNVLVGLGQFDASGGGFNNRNISKIVFLQEPKTVGGHIQAIGRGARPLFKGQEKFAREKIEVVTLLPTLPQELIKDLQKLGLPTAIPEKTIYESWHQIRQSAIKRYQLTTVRELSNLELIPDEFQKIETAINLVRSELDNTRLYTESLIAEHKRRNKGSQKQDWRSFVVDNLDEFLDEFTSNRSNAKALIMSGVEAKEVPMLLALNLNQDNIIAVDNSRDPNLQKATHESLSANDITFYLAPVEQILLTEERFSFISIDPYGPLNLNWIRTLQFAKFESLALSVNTLQKREDAKTSAIIKTFKNGRDDLALLAIKLCGTQEKYDELTKNLSGNLTDNLLFLLQKFEQLAEELSIVFKKDKQVLLDFLIDFALQSPLISYVRGYKYNSENNSPFASKFAAIHKWSDEITTTSTAENLNEALKEQTIKCVSNSKSSITLHSEKSAYIIDLEELSEIFNYWLTNTNNEYRFSKILSLESHNQSSSTQLPS
jgi:hypothetical protein